jgi:hypothetical protein
MTVKKLVIYTILVCPLFAVLYSVVSNLAPQKYTMPMGIALAIFLITLATVSICLVVISKTKANIVGEERTLLKITLDEYDDKIAFWHDQYDGDLPLHEYLGLSWEEYVQLVTPNK